MSLFRKKEPAVSALDALPDAVQYNIAVGVHNIYGAVVSMLQSIPPEHRKPIMDELTAIFRGGASKLIGAALKGGDPDDILTSVMASVEFPLFIHKVIASFSQMPTAPNIKGALAGESPCENTNGFDGAPCRRIGAHPGIPCDFGATLDHAPDCIGGEKGPCSCGAQTK